MLFGRYDPFPISEYFSIEKLLVSKNKKICILCQSKTDDEKAIFEIHRELKRPLTNRIFLGTFDQFIFEVLSENDGYYKGDIYRPNRSDQRYRCLMKLPASKTEIEARAFLLAECYETAEDYLKITKPYIEKNAPSNQWIYNILDGVAEKEDVVMNNEDFVLVRQWNLDRKYKQQLSYIALFNRFDLKSIRDLTYAEIPLIERVAHLSKRMIAQECGLNEDDIFAYFHYFPLYWQLHAHFKYKNENVIDDKFSIEQICSVLRESPLYFQTAKLEIKCKFPELAKLLQKSSERERDSARNQSSQIE